jgi:hypothetical protein
VLCSGTWLGSSALAAGSMVRSAAANPEGPVRAHPRYPKKARSGASLGQRVIGGERIVGLTADEIVAVLKAQRHPNHRE